MKNVKFNIKFAGMGNYWLTLEVDTIIEKRLEVEGRRTHVTLY